MPVEPQDEIVYASNDVMKAVSEMKDIERRKRLAKVSTPEYHELADESTAKSREIFSATSRETKAAFEQPSGSASIAERAAHLHPKDEDEDTEAEG